MVQHPGARGIAMLYKAFISYSHAADNQLAPALQSALRRIGKQWYRRSSFRIFLDKSSLSANPALWDAIEVALAQSEYLILLASTSSAQSEWAGRELDWWLTHRDPASILIVVTDGDVEWRPGDRDFDWEHSTALNNRLRGRFPAEPLWVDLRGARTDRNFSLRHKLFRNAVLQIAPPLYGKSREDLDDEDLRHYRSARRMAVIGALVLAALVLGIAVAARAARQQRRVADCRALAGQAINYLDTRLDLALLLGVESSRLSSCIEGRSALLSALEHRPHLSGFLSGHTDTVTAVTYTPDGRTLASSSWDKTVRFWDAQKREGLGTALKGMYGLSIHPDGTLLASADGQSVTLWKLPGGTPAGELPIDKRYEMSRVAFSPDGKLLATSNEPTGMTASQVFLWDVATRQLLGPALPGHIFAFSPGGKMVATEGEDGKSIVLWDLHTRRQLRPPLKGHTAAVRSIAFGAGGQLLAAGAEDNSVIVWDLGDRSSTGNPLIGHRAPVNALAFSPDAAMLASGSGDGSVILWGAESWQPIGSPLTVAQKPVFDLAFSPDGRTLVSNSEERLVIWNVPEGLPLGRELQLESKPTSGLAYSPDGKTLASIDTYGEVSLSDAETGRTLVDSIGTKLTSVAFSPDGTLFASVGWNGQLALWDRATGEPKVAAEKTRFRLFSVAFSPDGRTIAAGGDAVVLLWDMQARRWTAQITGQQKDRVWSLAFSPDGKLLASGGNTTLGLWDSKTGSPVIAPIVTDKDSDYLLQTNVAFSPNGKLLAYREGGNRAVLWDVAHRRPSGSALSGQKGTISALAFSPDGSLIATGADGAVVLWDVATHQPIGRPFVGMGDEVESLAFRPNGGALATLGDQRLVVWDVNEASWREAACRIANRNLTQDEWKRVFGSAAAYHETCAVQSFTTMK